MSKLIQTALYSLSLIYFERTEIDHAQKYYSEGLKAEANLLSFFLPFESKTKEIVSLLLDTISKVPPNLQMTEKPSSKPSLPDLDNPRRKQLIKRIRETRSNVSQFHASPNLFRITKTPPRTQTGSQFVSMKPVFLDDMDVLKDHTYFGRILNGMLVEQTMVMQGVYSLIQDETGDIQQIGFYNFFEPDQISEIENFFAVGQRLSISNPYMRIGADGSSFIRVDDPSSVQILKKENICFYCTKVGDLKTCSRCKKARYCSTICQTKDWKELDHKKICFAPKN